MKHQKARIKPEKEVSPTCEHKKNKDKGEGFNCVILIVHVGTILVARKMVSFPDAQDMK